MRYLLLSSVAILFVGVVLIQSNLSHAEHRKVMPQIAETSKEIQKPTPRVRKPIQAPIKVSIAAKPKLVHAKKTQELRTLWASHDVDVDKIKNEGAEVPRIHLAKVPNDIKSTQHKKKETFVQVVLPMVLKKNEEVLKDRERLLAIQAHQKAGNTLSAADSQWIAEQAKKYRAKSKDIAVLLTHVDAVPPSLALAQSSVESGWLTSRASRVQNSIFGHMATKTDVKGYDNLYASVESYIDNLNRHNAYAGLRKERALMREKGQDVCSIVLAKGLQKYSERGQAYIRQVQLMIRRNDFKAFDQAQLQL